MGQIESTLSEGGYEIVNVDYKSRSGTIEELAPRVVEAAVDRCSTDSPKVHFVTHSLGGILVRFYLAAHKVPRLGNVVMLAPPNHGSEIVDNYRWVPGLRAMAGPASLQLGTGETSVPRSLGKVDFPLGIIAGTKTRNPLLSLSLPDPDDGRVSVASTKVVGMSDHLEVPHSHAAMTRQEGVIAQIAFFLANGHFRRIALD